MPYEVKKCSCQTNDAFTISGGKPHYAPDLKLEPKHLDISINLQLENKFLEISVLTTIECNQPESSITFNGESFESLKVTDVTENKSYQDEVKFFYDGKLIHVFWENKLKKNEKRILKIDYQITKPVTGIQFNTENKNLGAYAVTDHETERARYWLACIDFPTVRTSLSFHLTSSKNFLFFANGLLEKEEINGDLKTSHWNCEFICPSYLICFAIGDFIIVEDESFENIPITYIAPKGTLKEDLKLTFDATPSIMKWLQNRVGVKFPFPKYFQVIAPWVGGAMENISLVTWDSVFLLDKKLAVEWKWLVDSIVLHECSHSYFGDALVIRHFEHAWLKESWASYMEVCWLADAYSKEVSHLEMYDQQVRYFQETKKYIRPIVTRTYDSSWDMFDRHLYPGGSWRLHMLKNLIGEDVFWEGVHQYVEKYFKKTVETDDFRKSLEEASGMNLTKFFDQWFYGKGYPQLEAKFNFDPKKKTCIIDFKQKQEDKKNGINIFNFDLDVELTLEDGTITTKTITFEEANASVSFDSNSVPKCVRIDPGLKILFSLDFNPGEDILFNTLKLSEDIFNKIRSGLELIKIGSYSAIQKVSSALKEEKFYGVRSVLASAFGEHKTKYTANILCEMLSSEENPMVLTEITQAMIHFREEKIKDSLLQFLQKGNELFYFSHAFALQALASQRFKNTTELQEIHELIVKHLESDDRYSTAFVRRGAWKALNILSAHHKESYEFMKKKVLSNDERVDSKLMLIESFSQGASNIEEVKKESKEILIELLRSEDLQVRLKALDGLIALKSTDKVGDMFNSFSLLPDYQKVTVEKKIRDLKKATLETPNQVRQSIVELQEKLRKIEEEMKLKK